MSLRRPRSAAMALILLVPALLAAAPAGKGVKVENIRVGFGEKYKIGAWTPVWVNVQAGAEPFEGTMEVVVDDESGTPTAFVHPHRSIGAGETIRLVAYVRSGSPMGEFTVRFRDKDGKVTSSTTLDSIRPNNPPATMYSDDIAILSLGKAQGVEELPKVAGLNGGRASNGNLTGGAASVVEVVRLAGLDGDLLPGRALGYDALDAVVIDTNDRDMMSNLAQKGDQLVEWVAQGGHLIVAVGANWQATRDSALGPILPATIAGTTTINDVRTIEAFAAGSSSQLLPDNTPLTVAKLAGIEARGGKILCATATSPLVVRGPYGFGRVTVVALDVDQAPFSTWADRALFWVKALDLRPTSAAGTNNPNRGRFAQFGVRDLSTRLREALEEFPGVKLVPFGWVAFFIFLYILLIGPGDYFLLRKVFKRMEFTWITFPAIVLIVSGVAYWAAYQAKGTELRVNQVEVVDVDIASKGLRGSTFVNVFSPQNRDYNVAVVPRPLPSASAKVSVTDSRISWFGAPEPGLRGMNGSGRGMAFGSTGYRYAPPGEVSRLEDVRIPIWSTKAFTSRWFGKVSGEPIIESDLTANGIDRLNGTITNRLDVDLKGTILAFNTGVYSYLGTLKPGETKRIELTQDRRLSGHLNDLRKGFEPTNPYGPQPTLSINRYALVQAILFHDSDISAESPLPSRPLHDLDLTGQLLLDRPMLVAEIDSPATGLDLGSTSGTPQGKRTTVLRVILPLIDPDAAKKKAK
jgi:hypothetical protein